MPIDQKKFAAVADAVIKTCDRFDTMLSKRSDTFTETEHPRDDSGKFTSVGGWRF